MNKWVVLVLMALAFLAGGLSFTNMGKGPAGSSPTPAVAGQAPASISPTPEVAAAATSAPTRPSRTGAKPRDPHFGSPPKAGGNASQAKGQVPGEIKAMVFSTKSDGDALTRFPAGTKNIYMTLTPSGMPDEVELVASFRSALKDDDAFSAPVKSSGPPRRRTFQFLPPKGGWASGPYQVVVKPANSEQVLTINRFEIAKAGSAPAPVLEKPEYLDLVRDMDAESGTAVFSVDDDKVYLRVASGNVPSSVKVRSVWSAVEAEELTPGELVSVAEVSAPGQGQDALFTFLPPKTGFRPGSYRVDVYYDQQNVGSQAFFIQPAPADSASATPAVSGTP